MKLYHTSPEKIEKIDKWRMFDDCLFFSTTPYVMTQADTVYTYSIEIDEDKIIDVYDLEDESIIKNISEYLEVDEDIAERILDGRDTACEHVDDAEANWWIQARQGQTAKLMGFEACRARDEQGTVYIIPMLGREEDLTLVSVRQRGCDNELKF